MCAIIFLIKAVIIKISYNERKKFVFVSKPQFCHIKLFWNLTLVFASAAFGSLTLHKFRLLNSSVWKKFLSVKSWQNKFPSSSFYSLTFSVSDFSFTNIQDNLSHEQQFFDNELRQPMLFGHKSSLSWHNFDHLPFQYQKLFSQTVFWHSFWSQTLFLNN